MFKLNKLDRSLPDRVKEYLVVTILFLSSFQGFSQGWVLDVEVNLNHAECAIEQLKYASASFNGFSSSSTGPFSGSNTILRIVGTGSTNGTLSINANGICLETYYPESTVTTISASYSVAFSFSTSCITNAYYQSPGSNPNDVSGTIVFYPRLLISASSSNCGGVSITINSCQANVLTWEFNTSPAGPNWYPIAGKSSQSILVTPEELFNSNFSSKYGKRSIRATGQQGTTSPLVVVDVFVPGPNLSIVSTQPKCPDGKGEIGVAVSNENSALVNDFVFSLYDQAANLGGPNPTPPILQGSITDAFTYLFTDILAGNYKIIAQNNSNVGNLGSCLTLIQDISITSPQVFSILSNPLSTPVSCNAFDTGTKNDGSVALNLKNGIAPYSYEVSTDGGTSYAPILANNPNTPSPVFNGLLKANYIFKAKYKSGSVDCVSNPSSSIAVGEPAELNPSVSKTDVLCRTKQTGAIDFNISNGNGGYVYSWTGSNYSSNSQDISPLLAGMYRLVVSDAKGCRPDPNPIEVFIIEPTVDFTITPSKISYGGFDITCSQNDGEIILTLANQATPLQSVNWKRNGLSFLPSAPLDAKNLSAASYTIVAKDNKGCDASASISLTQHPGISILTEVTSHFNGYNTKCSTSNEGEARVKSVTNGFGGYSYSWFDGTTSSTKSDLQAGNYNVTVTDGNGCSDSEVILISSPPPIQPHLQVTSNYNGMPISCPGSEDGRLEAFPVNGFGTANGASYYFSWSHDASIATKFAKNLGQGSYNVTVTDSYGCSASESKIISDPQAMNLVLNKKNFNGADVSCHNSSDGEIQLTVANGASPYSYIWSDGKTTRNNIGIGSGDYSVVVKDANACTQSKSIRLINPPSLVVSAQHMNNFNGFDIHCHGGNDGASLAIADGGTGAYNYLWSNGVSLASNSRLLSGGYDVVATDSNNCKASDSIFLNEPSVLSLTGLIDQPVSCFGLSDGTVGVSGAGGVSPYEFSIDAISPIAWRTESLFASLSDGEHEFYVRDKNGCQAAMQKSITQPEPLALDFQNVNPAACNDAVGSASVRVTGGNGGFVYKWTDERNKQTVSFGSTLKNVSAGVYKVTIMDSKNCLIADQVAISSIGGADFTVDSIVGVSCFGYKDGSSSVSVVSGIAPYTFTWSDGQSLSSASGLNSGKYFVTVTDGLGCKTIQQINIPTPEPLTAKYVKTMPLCSGDCNGQMEVMVGGGTAPYKYDWINLNQSNTVVSGLCAKNYDIKISDEHGCLLADRVELKNPEPLKISAVVTNPICLGRCDGSIDLSGNGGNGPYSFQWESGVTTSSLTNLCPANYTVQMKDSHDCMAGSQFTVLPSSPLPLDLGTKATLCVGQIKILDPGAQWVTSSWSSNNGFTNSSSKISIKDPGLYYFQGTDAIGCIAMDTFKLETSFDLLKAEFLMPAEVVAGDTLVSIDISWPLPEKIEWNYPSSFKPLTSSAPEMSFVQPLEPGRYSIGMKSFLAQCQDYREKTLTVLAKEKSTAGGRLGYEELIKEFTLFPNPNNGKFQVNVTLSEQTDITLRIIQFPLGVVKLEYSAQHANEYKFDFDLLDLPEGMYALMLHAKNQDQLIRFIRN